jgi:hypothetical protein
LTEDEMARLLAALKRNRHGQRDWLIGLLIYRHGLRVSEACDLPVKAYNRSKLCNILDGVRNLVAELPRPPDFALAVTPSCAPAAKLPPCQSPSGRHSI